MSELRKSQITFIGVTVLALVLHVLFGQAIWTFLAKYVVFWLVTGVIVYVLACAIVDTYRGKKPVDRWVEDDVNNKYE